MKSENGSTENVFHMTKCLKIIHIVEYQTEFKIKNENWDF